MPAAPAESPAPARVAEPSSALAGVTDETGQYKQLATAGAPGTCSIDLSAVTKWTGTKDLTLCIDPAAGYGSYVRIRSIKVCYP